MGYSEFEASMGKRERPCLINNYIKLDTKTQLIFEIAKHPASSLMPLEQT